MGETQTQKPAPETLDFPTTITAPNVTATTTTTMDDVFSVGNVELIDNRTLPHLRRRRDRPKKLPNHFDKPTPLTTRCHLARTTFHNSVEILTNAHSVEHYTQVKLNKHDSDTKYLATVLAIGTECDIGNLIT